MDVIPNKDTVDLEDDALRIRQGSEILRPGLPQVLRVITCPFTPGSKVLGATFSGSVGPLNFPFFVLINVNKLSPDRADLLHEMIHAATGLTIHDLEAESVFSLASEGCDRHWLKPKHAEGLSKSFFAAKS